MTPAQRAWKIYYRLQRIAIRECYKASTDMILYGNGYVRINPNGEAEHIPIEQVIFK